MARGLAATCLAALVVAVRGPCSDAHNRRGFERFSCAALSKQRPLGEAGRLCDGIARIHNASCAELTEAAFVEQIIDAIGLVPDLGPDKGVTWYGNASEHMVVAKKAGLWQEPLQISALLAYLASDESISVRTYLELGVYTCWMHATLAAFLNRISAAPVHSAAIDVTGKFVSAGTFMLLAAHNALFVHPGHEVDQWLHAHRVSGKPSRSPSSANLTTPAALPTPDSHPHHAPDAKRTRTLAAHATPGADKAKAPIDLCFIDAVHSHSAAHASEAR